MQALRDGVRRFHEQVFPAQKEHFARLEEGQAAMRAWLDVAGPGRPEGQTLTLGEMVRLNVRRQLAHLPTQPVVREAEESGRIALRCWVYELATGTVEELDENTGLFSPLEGS